MNTTEVLLSQPQEIQHYRKREGCDEKKRVYEFIMEVRYNGSNVAENGILVVYRNLNNPSGGNLAKKYEEFVQLFEPCGCTSSNHKRIFQSLFLY
jgi:hypothetical protein